MDIFEQSRLWNKNLGIQGSNDPYRKGRERLRQAFIKTRLAVTPLVAQIGKELPELTVHDITHLDNLWRIADLLIGDDFDINPAETFILGMTFLLHDAACSTFAFANGVDDLSDTPEWSDFVVQRGFDEKAMVKGGLGYKQALFETLRLLHAKQAEKLLTQTWSDLNGKPRHLMEDVELRNHYGRDIGRIAASHGKDPAFAEREWANAAPLTPHSCLELDTNANWKVDRLKIAMLLRCIDAAHIDNRRAPDMLAALIRPTGESKNHWVFQNRLGEIGINSQNELYWSGQTFEEELSDAWWHCYNVAKMIDCEIRTANRILKNNNRSELRAKSVMGATDIAVFLENVPVQGWLPVDVGFRIRDVGEVIEKFGGAKLYGNKPYLALRELIQNAADAIRARRMYRDKPQHGRIDISLKEENGAWWLHVQDDGVGMSRYVLTDVLLDFGRSLWRDSALREQWSGLAGKGFEAVGQFGIGFFSVFMLGDEIKVTTWRDGDAERDQTTLHLRQRTDAKPILLDPPEEQRLSEFGTRVSVRLNNGRNSLLGNIHSQYKAYLLGKKSDQEITLAEVVGILAPALDIDVWCQDGIDEKRRIIKANDWTTLSPLNLLRRVAPVYSETDLSRCTVNFLDIVENDGSIVGRVSFGESSFGGFGYDLGVLVHKGITVGTCKMSGLLLSTNNVDLARSLAQPICSVEALKAWAQTVCSDMKDKLSPWLSHKFLSLGLPAEQLPLVKLGNDYLTSQEITARLQDGESEEIVFMTDSPECPETITRARFDEEFSLFENVFDIRFHLSGRDEFGLGRWIHSLLPETDEFPRSNQQALTLSIRRAWPHAKSTIEERVVGMVDGEDIKLTCEVIRKS